MVIIFYFKYFRTNNNIVVTCASRFSMLLSQSLETLAQITVTSSTGTNFIP